MQGHILVVDAIAFSPDGKLLALAGWNDFIELWEVPARRLRATLRGHVHRVTWLAFSPDGRTLASGGSDETVRLWEVSTGKQRRTLKGHTDWIACVAFSPDGRTLASGSWDKTVRLWDIASGRERVVLREHGDRLTFVAFSPDGKWLATASEDKTIKLREGVTGREKLTWRMPGMDAAWSLAFSPDSKTLAFPLALPGANWGVKLCEVPTGRERVTLTGFTLRVIEVVFAPNGKLLACGSEVGSLTLWDVPTAKVRATIKPYAPGLCVSFSPDGTTLASASIAIPENSPPDAVASIVSLWDLRALNTTGK